MAEGARASEPHQVSVAGGAHARPVPPVARPRGRPTRLERLTVVLIAAGTVLLSLAGISTWAGRSLAGSTGFADIATTALRDPAVRAAVADQVVSALEEQPIASLPAVVAHPLLEKVVAEVVASSAFQDIFRKGVRELHAGLLRGSTTLLVKVDDAVPLVKDALRLVNPVLADSISDAQLHFVVGLTQNTTLNTGVRVAELAGRLAIPFAAAGVITLAFAIIHSAHRRRALQAAGATSVMTGGAALGLMLVGRSLLQELGRSARERQVIGAVFGIATHVLSTLALGAVLLGAVVVVAATVAGSAPARAALVHRRAALRRAFTQPSWRAVGCLGLAVIAGVALLQPDLAASVLLRAAGLVLLVVATIGVLELSGARRWPTDTQFTPRTAKRVSVAFVGALTLTSVAVFGAGTAMVMSARTPGTSTEPMAVTGCNGHVQLCDRRIDQVAFAGTHNSMAAAGAAGRWWFASQTKGIAPQLRDGIRAFLVDLHYGHETNGIVRSDFSGEVDRAQALEDIPPDERAVMERLVSMIGLAPPAGQRDVYLCHGYCEFGAVKAVDAFSIVEQFLRRHPNEVIVMLLEDHVQPADAVRVLQQSGLGDRAYTWQPGTPLPTLGDMIRSGHNVLLMVEHHAGVAPWYQPAFDHLLQETQFHFDSIAAMNCDLGRGQPDNPLLLVNHWLSKAHSGPADAAVANVEAVLHPRVDRCAAERRRMPNIVAVDFYHQGDLFHVVDELNGVAPP